MEILIAFFLFIGGFTLGSTTSHSEADARPDTVVAQAEEDRSGIPADASNRPCRYAEGPLVQRDLSVPGPVPGRSHKDVAESQDHACTEK